MFWDFPYDGEIPGRAGNRPFPFGFLSDWGVHVKDQGASLMSEGMKLEALDFAIRIVQEHEKKLDELVGRLEAITPTLEKEMNK